MEKYLNPFTDFGFKKLFGTEGNEDILISFLNEILPEKKIAKITYKKTEHLGQTDLDRKVIFDLYCESETGEKFIVELQKAKQSFFKDRSIFYSTFPIQEQAKKGEWNYELQAVYTIAILDFRFEDEYKDEVKVYVKLMDIFKKTVFYDKLSFIYLQMPNFNKSINELESLEDKWLFLLRNLPNLDKVPARLQEKVFRKVFKIAELAKFDQKERQAYEDSLKYYRDVKNSLDTAFEDGKEVGLQEGEQIGLEKGKELGLQEGEQIGVQKEKYKTAEKCLLKGFSVEQTAEITELSVWEVQKIAKNMA